MIKRLRDYGTPCDYGASHDYGALRDYGTACDHGAAHDHGTACDYGTTGRRGQGSGDRGQRAEIRNTQPGEAGNDETRNTQTRMKFE